MNHKIECAAAYIRVSTQEQKLHGLSLDAQRMKLKEYATNNNLKIVAWYEDEGVSGRKLIKHRPKLQQMLKDASKKVFQRIIFIKLDRYFRSVAEYHECQKVLDQYKITWTATEEKYNLNTASGRMFVNMKLTIAEFEADQTSERIKLVNEYKIKTKTPLYGDQALPFCFTLGFDENGVKRVVKNPNTMKAAEDMIQHFLRHHSIRQAMIYMNTTYNLHISYNAVKRLLTNPMLYGHYRGTNNYCEPYIDKETFDTIQDILNTRPIKSGNTRPRRIYIFSGLVLCPCCGTRLAGTAARYQLKDGTRREYKGYRCQKYTMDRDCDFKTMFFENTVEEQLLANVERFFGEINMILQSEEKAAYRQNKSNLNALYGELDRLNYSWQKGRIRDVNQYDKQYDELMEKIHIAEQQASSESNQLSLTNAKKALSGNWKEIYVKLDETGKRAFWSSFIKKIEFTKEKQIKAILFF